MNQLTPFTRHLLGDDRLKQLVSPFVVSGEDVTTQALAYLQNSHRVVTELMQKDVSPLDLHRLRSLMMDELIRGLWQYFSSQPDSRSVVEQTSFALMATGGYGREEMSLLSDIDLLFVVPSHRSDHYQQLAQKLLYVLWDLKLDVGHAVRTFDETLQYLHDDHTIFTALLNLRLIVGSASLFENLLCQRDEALQDLAVKRRIFLAKYDERQVRLKKFGDTVYLLEPHIKEGEGGLRDLQLIRWMAQIVGVGSDYSCLCEAGFLDGVARDQLQLSLCFLLTIRNKLHAVLGRKSDQITFDAQIILAKELDFEDDAVVLGVEKFMQAYYTVASQVNRHVKTLIQKLASPLGLGLAPTQSQIIDQVLDDHFCIKEAQIAVRDDDVFEKDITHLMDAFLHVRNTGLDLHFGTCEQIAKALPHITDDFRGDEKIGALFRELVSSPHALGHTLLAMHDVHFLDHFIPEFKKIRNRMQHDLYHLYTVDTHSLFAVNEVSKLASEPQYAQGFATYHQAYHQVTRKDLLHLGLLFHDIGKSEEGNHAEQGAQIADRIMQRLGYSEAEAMVVEFLVKSHLIMSHLSQRRDLQDLRMISEFAQAIKTQDNLRMLFLLTWADIRAVNTDAWTEWKDTLLQSLFKKTSECFSEQPSSEDLYKQKVADVRRSVLSRMQGKLETGLLEIFLQSISPRYVLAHSDEEIEGHFRLISEHDDSQLLLVEKEIQDNTMSEILVYTLSNPRVIPLVTGALLSLGINIMTMENFMLSDGHVLIKLRIQSAGGQSLYRVGLVEPLRQNLYGVFSGKFRIDELIKKRRKADFMVKKPVQQADTQITIDNDVSAYYTVIDVLTHDRLGLIYDIVSCLAGQGCYVELSKISTKIDQVVDTLYLKDIFGQKITSRERLDEIKKVLYDVIDGKIT